MTRKSAEVWVPGTTSILPSCVCRTFPCDKDGPASRSRKMEVPLHYLPKEGREWNGRQSLTYQIPANRNHSPLTKVSGFYSRNDPWPRTSLPPSRRHSPYGVSLSGYHVQTASASTPQSHWFAIVSFHSKPAVTQLYGSLFQKLCLTFLVHHA